MFERLLKAAQKLAVSTSLLEVPETLTQAVPEHVTAQEVRDLLPEAYDEEGCTPNIIATLRATLTILKSGKVATTVIPQEERKDPDEGDDGEEAADHDASLGDIAVRIGRIMAPICATDPMVDEDETDYAALALRGDLCLHILQHLVSAHGTQLSSAALIGIIAYTEPSDPWVSSPKSSKLADSLLATHFDLQILQQTPNLTHAPAVSFTGTTAKGRVVADLNTFLTENVLQYFLRPLFSKSRPITVTASGRKAEFAESSRYDDVAEGRETREAKPWKYGRRYAITVFAWTVRNADQTLLQKNWPLYTPVLLTLLDEPISSAIKIRALSIFRDLWARCPRGLMQKTGLVSVFEQAVFPAVLSLPSLTPEDESLEILNAAYPALFDLAGIALEQQSSGEDYELQTRPAHEFTTAEEKLLDKIVREGIMTGYHHAKEHIRLVRLFCDRLCYLVYGMGIRAIKYLKDMIPMIGEIMTDPFGTKYPPALLSATNLLKAVLRTCWPRIPGRCDEIIKILTLCWLNIDEEESFPSGNPTRAELESALSKTAEMLAAIMDAAQVEMRERVGPLIEKESRLRGLFEEAGECDGYNKPI